MLCEAYWHKSTLIWNSYDVYVSVWILTNATKDGPDIIFTIKVEFSVAKFLLEYRKRVFIQLVFEF